MRKLEVLNTNYEKSGLYAKIPALNDMTLKEFFEGLNLVKNYDSVRTFNNAVETVDESILIDSSVSLISGHEYFSAFDLLFKTMPADAPDSYRLWVTNEGVTDTVTHSFLTNEKEVFMNVKTSASSRTADLYLNLFGMTIGQSMSLETDLYFIIDLSNLSFEVTKEQVYYYYRMYRYLKDSKSFDGFTYLPKGQSKYDVAYVNKTIDEPIAELNGHTLREVFEQRLDFTTFLKYTGTSEIIDGVYIYTANITSGTSHYLRTGENLSGNLNDKFYFYSELKHDYFPEYSYNLLRTAFGTGILSPQDANLLSDTEYVFSSTIKNWDTAGDTDTYLQWRANTSIDWTGIKAYIKEFNYVPLTQLGISESVDMDYYYSLYQARKNITKKMLTYADIFEDYNEVLDYSVFGGSEVNNVFTADGTQTTLRAFFNTQKTFSSKKLYQYFKWQNLNVTEVNTFFLSYRTGSMAGGHASDQIVLQGDYITLGIKEHSSIIEVNTNGEDLYISNLMQFSSTISQPSFKILEHYILNNEHFDELITKEQLDTMLAHYLLVKNIVIYPEIYVPTDPTGFGNRYAFLEINKKVYGHELDFEDISFKMYFGVNFDAYKGYHAMMNMLRSNKAIIEYDWGIGPRYNDVRLLNAPKTEKDTSLLIISKFYFKRLNPFYELIEVSDEEDMKNESDLDSPVKLDLTVSNTTVSIKLLDASSGVQQEISFDFTGVSTPFNLTIDPETKKLLIDDITDAYDYADHTKDSFIYLPGDSEIYSINITGAAVNKITYKKWVIS